VSSCASSLTSYVQVEHTVVAETIIPDGIKRHFKTLSIRLPATHECERCKTSTV